MSDELSAILTHALSRPPEQPSECDSWTDEEIVKRVETASPLAPDDEDCSILVLCPDTILKFVHGRASLSSMPPEAQALDFVRSHTSIPVPRLRRYVPSPKSGHFGLLVMEKIEGTSLDKAWPRLNTFQRFLVSWTLRGYVEQLRRSSNAYSRRHVPGPMYETPQASLLMELLLNLRREPGPFPTCKDLIDYFNCHFKIPSDALPRHRFDEDVPLVFTHGDLCPHNIILGDDGRVWLIDFGCSGFYPAWFAYIEMMGAAGRNCNYLAPLTWWDYMPLVTGGIPVKEVALMELESARYRFHMAWETDSDSETDS